MLREWKQSFLIPRSQHKANRKQTTGGEIGVRQTSPSTRPVPDFAAAPWERSPSWAGKDHKAPSAVKAHLQMMVFNGKLGFRQQIRESNPVKDKGHREDGRMGPEK